MCKKLFSCCIALLMLSACASPQPQKPSPIARSMEYTIYDNNDVFEQYPDPIALQPPDKYWDVSNVDISDVNLSRKLIAFSFDDAPARTIENIITAFASFNESNPDCKASCTLFFNGCLFDNATIHL